MDQKYPGQKVLNVSFNLDSTLGLCLPASRAPSPAHTCIHRWHGGPQGPGIEIMGWKWERPWRTHQYLGVTWHDHEDIIFLVLRHRASQAPGCSPYVMPSHLWSPIRIFRPGGEEDPRSTILETSVTTNRTVWKVHQFLWMVNGAKQGGKVASQ